METYGYQNQKQEPSTLITRLFSREDAFQGRHQASKADKGTKLINDDTVTDVSAHDSQELETPIDTADAEQPQFMTILNFEGGLTGLVGTALGSLIAWIICKAQEL